MAGRMNGGITAMKAVIAGGAARFSASGPNYTASKLGEPLSEMQVDWIPRRCGCTEDRQVRSRTKGLRRRHETVRAWVQRRRPVAKDLEQITDVEQESKGILPTAQRVLAGAGVPSLRGARLCLACSSKPAKGARNRKGDVLAESSG